MRRALLGLHLLSAVGLMGALAVQIAVAAAAAAASALPGLRLAVAAASSRVVMPALGLMVVSGLLLIAARPELLERRWLLAKAGLGATLVGLIALPLGAAVRTAQALAARLPLDPAAQAQLELALQSEQRLAWAALALAGVAAALALWRPRLGQPEP